MAKQIDIRDTIKFPRDLVFEIYRDHLAELDAYLPNIDEISVENREECQDGSVELTNLWRASRKEVPSVIRPFVKPELLQWLDHARWDSEAYECHWRTELSFLGGAISSSGVNYYRDLKDGTMEIHLTGTIEVDPAKVPGPKLTSKKVAGAIESGVLKMTEPNLVAINRGFEQYIAEQHGERARAMSPLAIAG